MCGKEKDCSFGGMQARQPVKREENMFVGVLFFALVRVRDSVVEAAGVSPCQAEISIAVGWVLHRSCMLQEGVTGLRMLGLRKFLVERGWLRRSMWVTRNGGLSGEIGHHGSIFVCTRMYGEDYLGRVEGTGT